MSTQRPVGVMPMKIWLDIRHADLRDAIRRYQVANIKHPEKWERELKWIEELRQHERSSLPSCDVD